jgi:hypothetical protein
VAVDYFAVGVIAFECMMGKVIYLSFLYFRGHILGRRGRILEIILFLNRFKSKGLTSHLNGASKEQTLSIS